MIKKILAFSLIAMMIFSVNIGVTAVEGDLPNNSSRSGNAQYSVTEAQGPVTKAPEPAVQEQEPVAEVQKPVEEEQENKRIIDPDKPMIALTFDDGPSRYTPEILEVLKENNSAATFFVLGSEVNKFKDTLNQMIEEGNEVGNHTYNHRDLTKVSDEELYKQIQGTDDLVYNASGYTPAIMRPPYGASNDELNKKISKPVIKWSIDTRDWENRNVEMITNEIFENVKDGDIILMHDLYDSTAEAAKIVIPQLVEMGYQLVTVSELSEYRGVSLTAGQQYYNMYK